MWVSSGALQRREEALQPVEVLRLDVSEGVRASLDCRHRRVHWQDAHQYEKKPSHFSERYEIFTHLSLWVCVCVSECVFVFWRDIISRVSSRVCVHGDGCCRIETESSSQRDQNKTCLWSQMSTYLLWVLFWVFLFFKIYICHVCIELRCSSMQQPHWMIISRYHDAIFVIVRLSVNKHGSLAQV